MRTPATSAGHVSDASNGGTWLTAQTSTAWPSKKRRTRSISAVWRSIAAATSLPRSRRPASISSISSGFIRSRRSFISGS
jgi:hypothetical protein